MGRKHRNIDPEGGAGVTWQEELRKLDEDLAAGTLSADEYRVRRDHILSAAVASPDTATQQRPSSDESSTQIIEPVSPPAGMPQPPATQQQQQAPQQPHSGPVPVQPEATQVVGPYDNSAERTQAVPQWQSQRPPAGFAPQQAMQSPPGGFAAPPQWNAPAEDSSPPWGGGDLPPIAPPTGSAWTAQGPESFSTEEKPPGNGRKILFSALAVIVVVGLGVAVWLLFIRDTNSGTEAAPGQLPPAASPTSTAPLPMPPAARPEPSSDEDALITAPGTSRGGGGNFDIASLSNGKLLPDPMIAALQQNGMTSGRLNASTQDSTTIGLFSLTLPNSAAARTVADTYADTQRSGGLSANRDLSMQGVPVFSTSAKSAQGVFRAVYVLYNRVIIVETFGGTREAVQNIFVPVLQQQVDHAPPTQHTP
ncbi:MAG TPA: DUF1707 domain-containing protein [Amycolatopsis sp.]|nr:DUF1707 domain-containing protein [Amycolatopsis sp.]